MSPQRNIEHATEQTMHAIALNEQQALRLWNPGTPEPDSLLEYVEVFPLQSRERRALRGWGLDLFRLNGLEGDACRDAVAVFSERCRRRYRYGVKNVVEELRPLLRERDGVGFVRLVCAVRRLLAHEQVGRDVLLSGAVAHELGAGPFDYLRKVAVTVDAVERETVAA